MCLQCTCVCVRVCAGMYVYVQYMCVSCWGCEWEGGVSLRDVNLWCFPNRWVGTIAHKDMMPSSDFLSCCFIFAPICVNFHSISCIRAPYPGAFVRFSLSLLSSRRTRAIFSLFLWMRCVVYSLVELFLSVLMMHSYSVTTHFLLCRPPPSSYWLRLSYWL